MKKISKKYVRKAKLISLGLTFGLIIFPMTLLSHINHDSPLEVKAADYSGVSGGFSHTADGTVSASFTVTNNTLDMRGWLLCLFESKPSVNSDNKLDDSNEAHPYSYSACKHYFFASNTSPTGNITVTWSGTSADQKQGWSSGESTGSSGQTLKDYLTNGTNWHLIIGPRHYNTGWGDSGIGAGTNGYWENCDYYVGALSEVFPDEDKDMNVSCTSVITEYDGKPNSIDVIVWEPTSGYTIKYRTTSSGEYNLTTNPTFTNVGFYSVYYQVTASGYKTYTGSATIQIEKGSPTYTPPKANMGLLYNGEGQQLVTPGSTDGGTMVYSLDGSNFSEDIPVKTLVGEYTVHYKVQGDSNWYDTPTKSLSVRIDENDKDALDAAIGQANEYVKTISSFSDIATSFKADIETATTIFEDPNKTIEEIAEARINLIEAYDVTNARVTDAIILKIGEVRYTDACLQRIVLGENAYGALTPEQQALVQKYDQLSYARVLYEKFIAFAEGIGNIGEVTYDSSCYDRIAAAIEARDALSIEEQMLVPTLCNELKFAEDIYNVLGIIDRLEDVKYTDEYKETLDEARNAYDALDDNEQGYIYNYQDLLDKEETYSNVDHFVNLVNAIDEELEYVGTHNKEIDKAREAYKNLTPKEKVLVPEPSYNALITAEEEYQELKIEHERKEVEDREAGVVIATKGGSGIPDTVSIDINNSNGNSEDMQDNINYETINNAIGENEDIASICDIKFYQEVDGEIVEISLSDIEEGMSIVTKLNVPEEIDDSDFRIVLLTDDNELINVNYTYDRSTRIASITTDKVGTFAILTPVEEAEVAKGDMRGAFLLAVGVTLVIIFIGYYSIKMSKKKNS